jgi:predicted porin
MKKSLVAMAVAGAFAAPAAMADVTISGAINLGIEVVKSSAPTAGGSSITRNQLNANYSNINISSTDDIGNGNKVVFNYQLVVDPSSVSGNPVNRNSYLGLAGNWGAFKMGTNENVYERHMYQADPLDGALGPGGNLMLLGTAGGGTAFDVGQTGCSAATAAGCSGFYRRANQVIWYESPNWNGFTFEVDYTLSAAKDNVPGTDPKLFSIGAKYAPEGAPFYVDIAYEKHTDMFGANQLGGGVTGTGSDDDGIQIGGGFSFGDLGLHARFERLSYSTEGAAAGITDIERDAYWFGAKYNLPSGYIGAEIGVADEWDCEQVGGAACGADTGAMLFGIGYFHNLSKQSQLQFIYGRTDNDAAATYTQAAAPLGGQAGSDHQVLHVGIKHTF